MLTGGTAPTAAVCGYKGLADAGCSENFGFFKTTEMLPEYIFILIPGEMGGRFRFSTEDDCCLMLSSRGVILLTADSFCKCVTCGILGTF